MTQAVKRKVSDIVKTDLDRRFRQHLVFDPIMVEEFPLPSFIAKNEWDQWTRRNKKVLDIGRTGVHLSCTCC